MAGATMTPSPQPAPDGTDSSAKRHGPADRRLGERRLQLLEVDRERRITRERRRPVGRRESVGGHIRNAIQVLEGAIVAAERDGTGVDHAALVASLLRMRLALREADRLATDRRHLGQLLRVTERGLPPDTVPGLRDWPS